jgi:8-oxo-dGTP pyrophosphatase MutT (NUDIX family)
MKLLFMKPSDVRYGGKSFQLCKGKIEGDASVEAAAKREAKEELGLVMDNVNSFDYLFSANAYHASGRVQMIHLFIAEVIDPFNLQEFHYETGEVKWFTIEESLYLTRKCHRPIIYNAIEILKKRYDIK